MSVSLPQHFKGTHMSRFIEVLNEHRGEVTMRTLPRFLADLRQRLERGRRRVEVALSLLHRACSPVSGAGLSWTTSARSSARRNGDLRDFILRQSKVPVTSLCPCSKAISDYGAHNQRGYITIDVTRSRVRR